MTNKELKVESKVDLGPAPSLLMLFGQVRRDNETNEFLIDDYEPCEFPSSVIAQQCASELEVLAIKPEPQSEQS